MRESNFEQQPNIEKEPIVDIEIDKEKLEEWKELEEASSVLVEGFEGLVEPGSRFSLHPKNFDIISDYDSEDREEEDLRTKIILNYTFKELDFDPKDCEVIREDEGIKFFKTNRPNILLTFDGTDWCLEPRQDSELQT